MTPQTVNAIASYRRHLEKALEAAPQSVKTEAIEDANEFLADEVRAMDVGRLSSQDATYERFIERFGTPEQLAASYMEQSMKTPNVTNPIATIRRPWKRVAADLLCLMLVSGGFAMLCSMPVSDGVAYAMPQEPPTLSPFTDVRFEQGRVMVTYQKSEYEWLEFDDIAVADIAKSSKDRFGDRWKKRIAEDLVEVIWGMGKQPGLTAKLRLLSKKTNQEVIIEKAAMTHENRQAVWRNQRKAKANVAMKIVADSDDLFREELKSRWAYYPRSAEKIDQSLAELRKRITTHPDKENFALELQKVIASSIDGHAGVSGWRLKGRCLPFLIEPIGDRLIAFDAARAKLVDADHPFIQSIDGIDMNDWIALSSELVAKGSKQLIQQRSARLLRHIDHWRNEKGLPVSPHISVTLSSEDGDTTTTKELATAERKPIYGKWPRTRSHLLNKNIGYLRIPRMNEEAVDEIKTQMGKFKGTKGLIVDVRGNGGGSRDALRTLASYLISLNDPPRIANVAKYRRNQDFRDDHLAPRFLYRANFAHWTNAEKQAITEFAKTFKPEWEPPADQFSQWHYMVLSRLGHPAIYHYNNPVIVLSDAGCFSATDIFLAGLKGMPNVTIIGTSSSGGSARSVSFRMPAPNPPITLASMASFQPSGKLYDGNGVTPDQLVEPDPAYFIGGPDKVLEAAISQIEALK